MASRSFASNNSTFFTKTFVLDNVTIGKRGVGNTGGMNIYVEGYTPIGFSAFKIADASTGGKNYVDCSIVEISFYQESSTVWPLWMKASNTSTSAEAKIQFNVTILYIKD